MAHIKTICCIRFYFDRLFIPLSFQPDSSIFRNSHAGLLQKICKKLSTQTRCFPSNNNGSTEKGRYRAGRGANLAQWSFLGLKTKFFMFFSISQKYFLLRIFLVIGVKPGKPLGMGEKSKAARPESGKAKKSKNSSIY
ncbi:MAG: hypothetical protein IIB56_08340 [Planctomycetes bacterium]|nr:hypothetical protein [Planctomycetota bacterium]